MSNRPAMPAGLPACKQYINFKLVPRARGGTDKIPIDQAGNIIDAHDPNMWVDAATAWASPWNTHGIGFVGIPGWILIDLDKALRDGVWSPLVAELRTKLWGAYADVSPSGTGYHLIMRGTLPDGHKCKMEWGEIYSLGRFLTITGNHASGDANWDASDHTEWLVERFGLRGEPLPALSDEGRSELWRGPEDDDALLAIMLGQGAHTPGQMFDGQATARQVWNMEVDALARTYPADNRSDGLTFDYSSVDMSLMSHLSWLTGRDIERMQRLFERWPGYRAWKYQRSRGYHMHRILSRGCTNKHVLGERTTALVGREARPAEGAVSEPGMFFAYMPKRTFFHRPTREFWPVGSVDDLIGSVALPDGKTMKASRWLALNHRIDQLAWWPGAGEVIEGWSLVEGGWSESKGNRVLNTYLPPVPPQPRQGVTVDRWVDHLRMIYPSHVDVILDWMAFVAQNPTVKVNWCLVWGGSQGIGKDSMFAPLNWAVGEHNWQSVSPEQIMGEIYNDYLECRVLIIDEAKDIGGEGSRYQFYDKTKTIITAPPNFHNIRSMYAGRRKSPNLNATIITTNYRTGGLYLPADDRRHYVMFSDLTRNAFSEAYWSSYWEWMNGGGADACAAFLLARDVSRFNPKAPPTQTAEFWDMVDGGQPAEQTSLSDLLNGLDGFILSSLPGRAMMGAGDRSLYDWLSDKKNGTKIMRALNDAGYVLIRNPHENRGRWFINGKQEKIYVRQNYKHDEQILVVERIKLGR